jgi:hypothetical protein
VSNTSQLTDCITISSNVGVIAQEVGTAYPDTITIDTSAWNMNSGTGSSYYYTTGAGSGGFSTDTITISGGGSGYTIGTIDNISTTSFNWKNEEFVDCLPDFERVKSMCEQYPGLKIAYEKFVTTYKLVKDDYDSPKD